MAPEPRERLTRHTTAGHELVRKGRFQQALAEYESAGRLARKLDDADLTHEASLNASMVLLEMGDLRPAQKGLREIILRSSRPEIVLGACYNLAISLRKQGNTGRALVYGLRAADIARKQRSVSSRAMCHNLLGNIYLGRSDLNTALAEYRQSLSLRRREKTDNRFSLGILHENIGYCLLLKRQFKRGLRWIHSALEIAKGSGDLRCQADCHQDLCYAHLRKGSNEDSTAHGERALALALQENYKDIERNCYYMLGQAAHLTGDTGARDRYFSELQSHYPGVPFLRDFLCSVDVTGIITLKA